MERRIRFHLRSREVTVMKHGTILLCLALLSIAGFAQTTASKPMGTVPFELVDNRVVVAVMLNGKGPFHMILDTGAHFAVSPETAEKIGARKETEKTMEGVGEKKVPSGTTHINEAVLGPVQFKNQPAEILEMDDMPPVFGTVAIDGVLGAEVFKNYVVSHDYQKKELTFYDPKTFSYKGGGESIPFEWEGTIPVIRATLDGVAGKFFVDTGARSALILFGPFVAQNHLDQKYDAHVQGISGWGLGGPVRSYMVRTKDFTFGNFSLRGLIARLTLNKSGATLGASEAGLIGPDVLKQFVVICDYARQRLIFEKNSWFGRHDSYDRAGLWIAQKGNAFEVLDVISGGPADHAGLKAGDIVLAVNGKPTSDLILPKVRDGWKYDPPGTLVRLEVQTASGEKRKAEFELKDLV